MAGKSAAERYPEAQIFLFDKDYSLYGATLMAGGAHYDLGVALSSRQRERCREVSRREWILAPR